MELVENVTVFQNGLVKALKTELQMATKEPGVVSTFKTGGKRKNQSSHDVVLGSSFGTKMVVVG